MRKHADGYWQHVSTHSKDCKAERNLWQTYPKCCTRSGCRVGSLTSCSTVSLTAVSWAQTQDLLLGALAASGEERSACQVQHSAERSAALSKRGSCEIRILLAHAAGPRSSAVLAQALCQAYCNHALAPGDGSSCLFAQRRNLACNTATLSSGVDTTLMRLQGLRVANPPPGRSIRSAPPCC